jgi:hypothetical protein
MEVSCACTVEAAFVWNAAIVGLEAVDEGFAEWTATSTRMQTPIRTRTAARANQRALGGRADSRERIRANMVDQILAGV